MLDFAYTLSEKILVFTFYLHIYLKKKIVFRFSVHIYLKKVLCLGFLYTFI